MIYFDQSATTKPYEEVVDSAIKYMVEEYGNPSAIYPLGIRAKDAIEEARKAIANTINANPEDIYFTSGATEVNNWITSFPNVFISPTVHPSLNECCRNYLDVNKEGFVTENSLSEWILGGRTNFVCVSGADSEIGTIQNLKSIGDFCRERNSIFYVDATQLYGHHPIDVNEMNVDVLCTSAHKFHGLKGVGFVYINNRHELKRFPFQRGGYQENKMRAGTENVAGIVSMRIAAEKICKNMNFNKKDTTEIRNYIYFNLLNRLKGVYLNGTSNFEKRLSGNLNFRFEGIKGEELQSYLSLMGICVSTGSACHSSSGEPSKILKAIGLSDEEANSSIRLSFDETNTLEEAKKVVDEIVNGVNILRR